MWNSLLSTTALLILLVVSTFVASGWKFRAPHFFSPHSNVLRFWLVRTREVPPHRSRTHITPVALPNNISKLFSFTLFLYLSIHLVATGLRVLVHHLFFHLVCSISSKWLHHLDTSAKISIFCTLSYNLKYELVYKISLLILFIYFIIVLETHLELHWHFLYSPQHGA